MYINRNTQFLSEHRDWVDVAALHDTFNPLQHIKFCLDMFILKEFCVKHFVFVWALGLDTTTADILLNLPSAAVLLLFSSFFP